jgi:hypothetical protein
MKYKELDSNAKEKARDWAKEAFNDIASDAVRTCFEEELEKLGLPTEDICWRLSYCQGDGMAFYGKFDLAEFAKTNKESPLLTLLKFGDNIPSLTFEISRNGFGHHYSHYNTMDVSLYEGGFDLTTEQEAVVVQIEEYLREFVKTLSKRLEKKGYDILEFFESEEYLQEAIEENDYEFDEFGERLCA